MPEQLTRLRVFISCPGNLDAERAVITRVLADLSSEFSDDRLLEFKVFNWKQDAVPGVGFDTQSVINSQLKYDIYIGVLSTVFGTPTPRAGSGTEDEFNDAYAKFKANPTKVRVLFYFKQLTDSVFELDPIQFAQVKLFRASLGPKGVLYHDFRDMDSLYEDVRSHMRTLIRNQWDGQKWIIEDIDSIQLGLAEKESTTQRESTLHELETQEEENQQGILEIVIEGKLAGKQLTNHLATVTKASQVFGDSISKRNDGYGKIDSANDPEAAKRFFDAFAEEIRLFRDVLQTELPTYEASTQRLLKTVEEASRLFFEENTGSKDETKGALDSFENLTNSIRSIRETIQSFRNNLERAPSMTMDFRAAKKYLTRTFDEYISAYTNFLGLSSELIVSIRSRLAINE